MDAKACFSLRQLPAKYALPPVALLMRSKAAVETRLFLGEARADDIDDGAGRLRELRHVFGRNRTGVVRAVREDDDGFLPVSVRHPSL